MTTRHLVAALAAIAALSVGAASAQVHRCQDASGKLVYSDRPCAQGQHGEQIERRKSQAEIAREREQAYNAEMRKQQRNLTEQQSDFGSPADRQLQQAPIVRQAGGDWAARKAQENAATSAGSISNNGGGWDRAAEAERDRVRQEEARRRPVPPVLSQCSDAYCTDSAGNTYYKTPGTSGQMTRSDGKTCYLTGSVWNCN